MISIDSRRKVKKKIKKNARTVQKEICYNCLWRRKRMEEEKKGDKIGKDNGEGTLEVALLRAAIIAS
jgi:hypothetical protein